MSKRYQGGILGVGFNPLQAPNAPTIGTATAGGNNCASVPFTAPANVGGSAITGYTWRSDIGGFSGTAVGSPISVTGLSNGTSYTFGVFALNSYGPSPSSAFSNSVTAMLDGTFGIFALGSTVAAPGGTTTRDKYTYASCSVSAGSAATYAGPRTSAAGNSTRGIFALGFFTAATNKYTYSGDVVSAGTSLTTAAYDGEAAGNSTTGIFALGLTPCPSTTRNKYTYSGCVVGAATAATTAATSGSATGNSTVGIFALGNVNGGGGTTPSTTRNKYTYSNDVVSAGGAATVATYCGSAAGNNTVGIFALSNTNINTLTTRNKYTYSGDVVSAGGAATVASYSGSATGNSVVGIFALGRNACGVRLTTRNKYTYSGCVVTAGGAATAASDLGSAASNGIAGITL